MSFAKLIAELTASASVPAIEHEHLQQASLSGECHVVDVREPHEYEAGHIPGAINQPLSQFDPSALPGDKPVVLVCQAGGRSARALQAVLSTGRKDVVHYAPGTGGWRARGAPIES